MHHLDDTIAAIASAPGGAARGIVRVSGRRLLPILEGCFRAHGESPLAAVRRARVVPGTILISTDGVRELPADLLLWPTARSYTREPLAELHTLGSPPLLSAVLRTVCSAGARLAEPGEFTLRAFLAGRLDLVQAEAVLGVIDARDPSELQEALGQLAGGLTRPLHQLRQSLIELLAHIEAGLDFVEEDIQFIEHSEIGRQLDDAAALVEQLGTQLARRGRHDVLPSVVLIGSPNVGKSSLFNALTTDGSALVADQPGTTRDYLTATLELDGLGCRLFDTAGTEPLEETVGDGPQAEIGGEARSLAAREARRGDLRLLCLDSTRELNAEEEEQLAATLGGPRLIVLTKCDRPRRMNAAVSAIETSAHSGLGLARLRHVIGQTLIEQTRAQPGSHLTADRCGESLRRSAEALVRAAEINRSRVGQELVASELRVALDELSSVVGATYTDDILDRVFSRFCIGK